MKSATPVSSGLQPAGGDLSGLDECGSLKNGTTLMLFSIHLSIHPSSIYMIQMLHYQVKPQGAASDLRPFFTTVHMKGSWGQSGGPGLTAAGRQG